MNHSKLQQYLHNMEQYSGLVMLETAAHFLNYSNEGWIPETIKNVFISIYGHDMWLHLTGDFRKLEYLETQDGKWRLRSDAESNVYKVLDLAKTNLKVLRNGSSVTMGEVFRELKQYIEDEIKDAQFLHVRGNENYFTGFFLFWNENIYRFEITFAPLWIPLNIKTQTAYIGPFGEKVLSLMQSYHLQKDVRNRFALYDPWNTYTINFVGSEILMLIDDFFRDMMSIKFIPFPQLDQLSIDHSLPCHNEK